LIISGIINGIVILHDTVNRAALIEQIEEARQTLEKLLALLQLAPVERDRFVPTSIRPGGLTGERAKLPGSQASKSGRCVISSFQVAESMGFTGECRQWEHLLRIGE
jgi:hypothetical protein